MMHLRSALVVAVLALTTLPAAQARDSFVIGINIGSYGYAPPPVVTYHYAPPVVHYPYPHNIYYVQPQPYVYSPTISYGHYYGGHSHHNHGYRGYHGRGRHSRHHR